MLFVLGEMAQQGLELIEYEETEDKSTQDNAQTEVLVPRRPAKTAQAQAPKTAQAHQAERCAPGQDHANGPAAGGVGLGGIQGQGSVLMGSVRHCKQCPVQKATYTVKQVNADEITMKES